MATVRAIVTDALIEDGVYASGDTPSADDAQLSLRYFQRQLDAWLAERATLAIQKRVTFSMPSGQSTRTVGPGGQINTVRPTWLDTVTYVNPGSSPEEETAVAILTPDAYATLSIKQLPSGLPLQCFYQTSTDTVLGTLFVYPQVTQTVTMYLYFPGGIAIPTTLDDILLAPPGYAEAFHYQLAERLLTPFAVSDGSVIGRVREASEKSYARMKRQNLHPGQLSVDPALIGVGGGYNIYSDTFSGSSAR